MALDKPLSASLPPQRVSRALEIAKLFDNPELIPDAKGITRVRLPNSRYQLETRTPDLTQARILRLSKPRKQRNSEALRKWSDKDQAHLDLVLQQSPPTKSDGLRTGYAEKIATGSMGHSLKSLHQNMQRGDKSAKAAFQVKEYRRRMALKAEAEAEPEPIESDLEAQLAEYDAEQIADAAVHLEQETGTSPATNDQPDLITINLWAHEYHVIADRSHPDNSNVFADSVLREALPTHITEKYSCITFDRYTPQPEQHAPHTLSCRFGPKTDDIEHIQVNVDVVTAMASAKIEPTEPTEPTEPEPLPEPTETEKSPETATETPEQAPTITEKAETMENTTQTYSPDLDFDPNLSTLPVNTATLEQYAAIALDPGPLPCLSLIPSEITPATKPKPSLRSRLKRILPAVTVTLVTGLSLAAGLGLNSAI